MMQNRYFLNGVKKLIKSCTKNNIIFFDGKCGLCNYAVDRFLSLDKHQVLKFAPLQGEYAKRVIPKEFLGENLQTLLFIRDGKMKIKSDAILEALSLLGGYKTFLSFIFRFIPRFARDFLYQVISKNRYKWFGKSATCRIPTKEERIRFLT